MLINRGTVEKVPVPSIVIEPIVDDIVLFEFKSAAKVLGNGYVAANEKMDSIKMLISRRENSDSLQCRRQFTRTVDFFPSSNSAIKIRVRRPVYPPTSGSHHLQ